MNPDTDVTILQIGDTPTRVAALMAKSVDGAIFDPPDHKKAIENGGRIMMNLEETAIPYQHAGLMTTRKYIAARPDIVRRVVKAIVEGAAVVAATKIREDRRNLSAAARLYSSEALSEPGGLQSDLNDLSKRVCASKSADLEETFQHLRGFIARTG